jgi:SAM-dependent methyltransferase
MENKDSRQIPCENSFCILCGSNVAESYACGFDYQYWTTNQQFRFVRCLQCHHVYLNPRPTIESADLIYPPNYYTMTGIHTEKYSKLIAFLKRHIIRRRLSFVRKDIGSRPAVLEVGCGDCALLLDLRKVFPEASLTGIDLFIPDSIHQIADSLDIKIIEGSIENTDLPLGSYDLVVMNQLIEHLWDPVNVLKKIRASLRPGGFVSIETPNIGSYDHKLFSDGTWGGFYFPRHLNLFNFKTLRLLLEKTGFKMVRQENLLAPIIWIFSFRAKLSSTKKKGDGWDAFLSDRSPACLAFFTVVDILAKYLGRITSNQKAIVRRSDD